MRAHRYKSYNPAEPDYLVSCIGGLVNSKFVLFSPEIPKMGKNCATNSRRFRVEGVPFFIVNGKVTLSGAQQPEVFQEVFRQSGN